MNQSAKPKNFFFSYLNQAIELLVVITLFGVFYFFLCVPHVTTGNSKNIMGIDTIYLSQRMSYIFELPKKGDFVIFRPVDIEGDVAGTIESVSGTAEVPLYNITDATKEQYEVPRDRIQSKIYYTHAL